MHSSLIFLTLVSLILIVFMVTCFFCFIRSRRKEDEELMERVQYNSQQQQQYNEHMNQQHLTTPQRLKQQLPSNNNDMSSIDNQNIRQQQINDYRVRNSFGIVQNSSPYHTNNPANQQRPEVQSDITQQINSAIIGSSEAEFQNDFIQVRIFNLRY